MPLHSIMDGLKAIAKAFKAPEAASFADTVDDWSPYVKHRTQITKPIYLSPDGETLRIGIVKRDLDEGWEILLRHFCHPPEPIANGWTRFRLLSREDCDAELTIRGWQDAEFDPPEPYAYEDIWRDDLRYGGW